MKKRFDPKKTVPGLPGIIVLSHGPMALSMIDSASLIIGDIDNLAAFTLEEGDDPYLFGNTFAEAIHAYDSGVLVLIDLYGGTPFNQVVYHCKMEHLNIESLTGVNMPMLIEAISSRGGSLQSWCKSVEENTAAGIQNIHSFIH